MASDRIFGAVVTLVALAYVASAMQIQTSFMADPVGPKTFPILIGCVAALCGIIVALKPDPDPDWPVLATFGSLGLAVVVLVGYAYALKPLGFLIPTAITASILSYQIEPRAGRAVLAGIGLSVGLFLIFKFALGLGLVPFPKSLTG
ncbi:tripartite tricarboxylate transporter TctB family protein [Aliiroseovarius sp. F47248L]|uniref:tripartite tricarboxylate transporter TctB family protein n=1 Tax=Aliiroseovarius sp. F47248L TaxID=2926420 RepID=UPI001FF103AA|nr:tripartite tricarboxylate transporter TctB family protein [Aliiroseovarius sp. F47248L]MCK0139983.1 tripartite tricarboxylate transporter TctB family protein [Aliiroseovarius sp. F47248L]